MTRVLIIGGTGMLGHKLVQELSSSLDVWTTIRGPLETVEKYGIFDPERTIPKVDVENIAGLASTIDRLAPDVVINAVGVIKQVAKPQDAARLITINSVLPHSLAKISRLIGFRLICISTDCVFSGETGNYSEDDIPDATDMYGRSKHLGEPVGEKCLTLRTSIIGRELSTHHSLVEWFLSNRGQRVRGYNKAIYTGFPTIVFAEILRRLIVDHPGLSGLYHVSSDPISKFDLLGLINEAYSAAIAIDRSDEIAIDRSLDSTKFRNAVGFKPDDWKEMIAKMAADQTLYDEWHFFN